MCIALAVILTAKRRQQATKLCTKEYAVSLPGIGHTHPVPENEKHHRYLYIMEWFTPQSVAGEGVLRLEQEESNIPSAEKAKTGVYEAPGTPMTHRTLRKPMLALDKLSFEAVDERQDDFGPMGGWSDYPGQSRDSVAPKMV
jgi:hypothetical protein